MRFKRKAQRQADRTADDMSVEQLLDEAMFEYERGDTERALELAAAAERLESERARESSEAAQEAT
jgi:hypothetical protein